VVVCGEHDLDVKEDEEAAMPVLEVVVHKDYRGASATGRDIAILRVDDSLLQKRFREGKLRPGGSIYPRLPA